MTDYNSNVETARDNFEYDDTKKEKKKGKYVGTVYYAANMPKSKKDTVPFDKKSFDLVEKAMKPNATREDVGLAMVYLRDIGYYDGEVDSLKGPMFMGAGQRLMYNKTDDNFLEEAKDFNIFKWIRGKSK